MQKLEKKQYINPILKANIKKKIVNKKAKFFKRKYRKNAFYILKKLELKWYRTSFQKFFTNKKFQKISKCLNIKVTSNNIFCNFHNRITNKTLAIASSGKYKIKTTRKKLRYSVKLVLRSFITDISAKFSFKTLVIKIIAPIRIKKQIISFLSDVLKHKTQKLIIKVLNKKCFNGCRPAKKKRKKQKGLRIFK